MASSIDLIKFKNMAKLTNRYGKQLQRLQKSEIPTDCIEHAVNGAIANLSSKETSALVIYGEPQSGKTEMMICLTARLLDEGHKMIIHLMNDSVDLLAQNLKRFKNSGLAPSARTSSELLQPMTGKKQHPQEFVVFCKKNARDLEKLIERVKNLGEVVVVDDEADYATPNAKVNSGSKTSINKLVEQLIGKGFYIGVTATPARLDLNHTFDNSTEKWVNFPTHARYTGQDVFFPLDKPLSYRLVLLERDGTPKEAQDALVRFLVTVAYLNVHENATESNYTMLVHTSGRKQDHETDRGTIEDSVHSLIDAESLEFSELVLMVHETACKLYPDVDADSLTAYVVSTASRANLVVLNSERDRTAAGDSATDPTSPFTIIVGGNIVSRGVTFPNLLSMFFTRDVRHKLQQDTYIQRARMFGARGLYLKHFELTIPTRLYSDWHRCFVFHRLALSTVKDIGSPVWIGDKRVAVTASASIDKATVALDKGEMSFGMFAFDKALDTLILNDQRNVNTLRELRVVVGNEVLPNFLIDYIERVSRDIPDSLAIHTSSSIEGYGDSADKETISRRKGFMGVSQMETKKFPAATHHIKIFYNENGKAKIFYKCKESMQFIQSMRTG
ncbi:Z1 domain-containing protein [Undibacterium sp. Di26W]|uniref:Z1 domain-containing protein n=1 Tax=Undibacterium sp. Di26W TaxID=3413035 RepID=UPI003BF3EBFC